ncbi:MAG: DUF2141 domain-containing protein [Burkholderiales bacterium]
MKRLSFPFSTARRLLCAAALIAPLVAPQLAAAADLGVTFFGGPAGPARVYAALYDSAEAFGSSADKAVASQIVQLKDGTAQVLFQGLPKGRYAVKAFADENGNGMLDKNLLGLPTERYGFSRDARGVMGPPGFDESAVELDREATIVINLK